MGADRWNDNQYQLSTINCLRTNSRQLLRITNQIKQRKASILKISYSRTKAHRSVGVLYWPTEKMSLKFTSEIHVE